MSAVLEDETAGCELSSLTLRDWRDATGASLNDAAVQLLRPYSASASGAGGMVRGARALSGAGDRLGLAVDAELGVDVAQVRPDRVRRTSRIVDRNVAWAVRCRA